MRFWALLFLLFAMVLVLPAQNASNPFELSPRLDPAARQSQPVEEDISTTAGNPFDLDRPDLAVKADSTDRSADSAANPFDLIPPEQGEVLSPKPNKAEPGKEEVPTNTGTAGNSSSRTSGSLLLIMFIVFGAATLSLIFFRGVYFKAYRALFNDNLLSQLYREREAGAFGVFLITYSVFFVAAGFFIVLALPFWGYVSDHSLWAQFLYTTLAVTSLMTAKHLILAIIGYVFPVQKETSRYSFTIMVFAIVIGLFLTVANLILAYIPAEYAKLVVYLCLGILLLLYLLRSFRGLFIANRFIFNYQFHFLSYICAVEIGPALCLFKFLTDF